jgi:hypothetical protein
MMASHLVRRLSLVGFAVVFAIGLLGFDGTLH